MNRLWCLRICYRLIRVDARPGVRLLASRRSGQVHVFTLVQNFGLWSVEGDSQKLEGMEHPLPRGTFVLNAKDGKNRLASQALLKEALYSGGYGFKQKAEKGSNIHCFWITCGEKGAKCTANFSGSRLGKVEWHKGKKVECVEVIFNKGM